MSNVSYIHRYIENPRYVNTPQLRDVNCKRVIVGYDRHYVTVRVERVGSNDNRLTNDYILTLAFRTGDGFSFKTARQITNNRRKFPELSILLTRAVRKDESFAERFLLDAMSFVMVAPYASNMGDEIPYWFKKAYIGDFKVPGRIARGKRRVRKPKVFPEGGC